jgi:hypothetical protein
MLRSPDTSSSSAASPRFIICESWTCAGHRASHFFAIVISYPLFLRGMKAAVKWEMVSRLSGDGGEIMENQFLSPEIENCCGQSQIPSPRERD